MIVPHNRLLLWFALVVLPFALLGAIEPAAMLVSLVCIGGFLVVVLADAMARGTGCARNQRRTAGRGAHVQGPRGQAWNCASATNTRQRKRLRLALALPRAIESPQEDVRVELPEASEWSRLAWPCLPRRRGNFRLEAVHIEAVRRRSASGPCAAECPRSARCGFIPTCSAIARIWRRCFCNRGAFGLHAQRQVGKGREFEKLREYVPGRRLR